MLAQLKLITLSLLLYVSQCEQKKCDSKIVICPALDSKYFYMVGYKMGDHLIFENEKGAVADFEVTSKLHQATVNAQCYKYGYNPCECAPCHTYSTYTAISDYPNWYRIEGFDTIRYSEIFFSVIRQDYDTDVMVNGDVLDLSSSYYFNYSPGPNQSKIDSVILGGQVYKNIVVIQTDTTANDQIVWKMYWSLKEGLVGFHDRVSNSVFYLRR